MYSLPSTKVIEDYSKGAESYTVPNRRAEALVFEGAFADWECDELLESFRSVDYYAFSGCGARTKEAPMPLSDPLDDVASFVKEANKEHWGFDLTDEHAAWLQTYLEGDSYRMHVDACPGQSRKMTAVMLLSKSDAYLGGELTLFPFGQEATIPKTRGTVVVFPSWVFHLVKPVTEGLRQSINFGFWGPPFR